MSRQSTARTVEFPDTRRPLRNRRYLAYALAVTISPAGTYAATVALSFGVWRAASPPTSR